MAERVRHNAIVTRVEDDNIGLKLRGGVFFEAPSLFEGEYPYPAFPCFSFASNNGAGLFFVPAVDDEIEVSITVDDGHSFDTSDIEVSEPRYQCMAYSDDQEIAREFKKNYTKTMGFKSRSGNILLFDDTEGKELVFLEHKFGGQLTFLENGNISLKARKVKKRDLEDKDKDTFEVEFSEILLDFENLLMKLSDHHGNVALLDVNGIRLIEKDGGELNLSGGKVALGKGKELLDIVDKFIAETVKLLDEVKKTEDGIKLITVPTAVGPSGVPINAATFTAINVTLATIKTALNDLKTDLGTIKGTL